MSRAVLITGASTGIGYACAQHLSHTGWRVFCGVRKSSDADRLRSEGLNPIILDVTDSASINAAMTILEKALEGFGLNGLINNAGIAVVGPLECIAITALQRQLAVNVTGQVAVTQACLPFLRIARGRIVMMGSIGGRSALPFVGAYNASKFALEAIADTWRVELAPWGIHVSIIEPGAIQTPIWEKSSEESEAEWAHLPSSAHALYGPVLKAMPKILRAMNKRGIPPASVAEAVEQALSAKQPRNRYVVGFDAKQRLWLERLPDWLRDRLIRRFYPPFGPN